MSNQVEDARITAANLRKLAPFIRDKQIKMSIFFNNTPTEKAYVLGEDKLVETNWCGASACALGWATTHPDMPVLPEHFDSWVDDSGREYNMFVIMWYQSTYFPSDAVWDDVFDPMLPDEGAAQRCIKFAEYLEGEIANGKA